MRKLALVIAMAAGLSVSGGAAHAAPDLGVFDGKDGVWGCFGDAGVQLPPNHCINQKGKGKTGVILVFLPDPRGPQESYSTDPRSDTRPCPHDSSNPDADGTWWSPVEGLWVCHHRP